MGHPKNKKKRQDRGERARSRKRRSRKGRSRKRTVKRAPSRKSAAKENAEGRTQPTESVSRLDGFAAVLPVGFALFEEGGEAFFEVGSATDAGVFEDGAFEVVVETGSGGGSEQVLGAGDAGGAGGD